MQKFKFFGVGLGLVVVLGLVLYLFNRDKEEAPDSPIVGDCPITKETVTVKGPWLEPLAKEGDELTVDLGYYACHPVKKGEWAYYRYSKQREPVIKQIEAIEGDRFGLEAREGDQVGWHLLINGDRLKRDDTDYYFGRKAEPAIALYVKSRGGILQADEVILMSLKPPGREDSGMFGLMAKEDLIGRVRKPKRTAKAK